MGFKGAGKNAARDEEAFDPEDPAAFPPTTVKKRTICKFFEAGVCNRGDQCTWAHGPEDIGAPVLPVLEGAEDASYGGLPDDDLNTGKGGHEVKQDICHWWAKGECWDGDGCRYAHGEEEIGAPVLPRKQKGKGKGEEYGKGKGKEKGGEKGKGKGFGKASTKAGEPVLVVPYTTATGKMVHPEVRVKELAPAADARYVPPKERSRTYWPDIRDVATVAGNVPEVRNVPETRNVPMLEIRKMEMCKFWAKGQCTKGDACDWRHGDEPKNQPPPMVKAYAGLPAVVGLPTKYAQPAWKLPREGYAGPPSVKSRTALYADAPWKDGGPNEKKTMCKFWLEGACRNGDACTWAHGEDEMREGVSAVTFPVLTKKASAGSTGKAGLSQAAAEKRTPCKFWLKGHCNQGAACSWPHPGEDQPQQEALSWEEREDLEQQADLQVLQGLEEDDQHEVSHGALDDLNGWGEAAEGGEGDDMLERDYIDDQSAGDEPEAHVTPGGPTGPNEKKTMCRFWLQGACRNGDACTWAHGEEELMKPPWGKPVAMGAPNVGEKRTLCKFWLRGDCYEGDACTWAHGEEEIGSNKRARHA